MLAAIDVGSNTVRMLVGEYRNGVLQSGHYYRRITRLAGGMSAADELDHNSMVRTQNALKSLSESLRDKGVSEVRAVGTAALRRATNRQQFIDLIRTTTGLSIDVIDGEEEARLMSAGVLSAIKPTPSDALIIDIGGGSTEFVCLVQGAVCSQFSYPMGVVQLCEEFSTAAERHNHIAETVNHVLSQLKARNLDLRELPLIGTAGTMTTLAAIDLHMAVYSPEVINNHLLSADTLNSMLVQLSSLSLAQREMLIGMEEGRGDLIVPGLQIILQVMKQFGQTAIKVADSGLLEGVLLEFCRNKRDFP